MSLLLSGASVSSSIWGNDLSIFNLNYYCTNRLGRSISRVYAISDNNGNQPANYKMNLNEYMVTLEKPLGIRIAFSIDGKLFVHSLRKGGNAERSRIVMVGDTLKKASDSSGSQFIEIKDIGDAQDMLKEKAGSFSLVLERPFSPFPIHELLLTEDLDILFNRGRIPIATWNKSLIASGESYGNPGFVVFSSKFLAPKAWMILTGGQNGNGYPFAQKSTFASPISQIVCISSEDDSTDAEWGHGSFPLDEYIRALDRSKGELYYNHSLGMRYSKVTEQLYVGSCIQKDSDVEALANVGVTAVLNFQSAIEAENWGINSNSINECCQRDNILLITYPIREGDSFDMRKKLPFCVGLLLRLLKKNHRVFVTCTSGFDRSPACVIAYLHWMTDTSLNAAYNFVTGLHSCRPDRYFSGTFRN